MTRADDLRWLTAELESERGMGASHADCDDERELFDRFRALVNTRAASSWKCRIACSAA